MSKYKHLFSNDWYEHLKEYIESEHFSNVIKNINSDRLKYRIIPDKGSDTWFRAFRETPYNRVKAVCLGMDPFPTIEKNGTHTFDGLAFSNSNSLSPSPSLRNILKEVKNCYPDTDHIDELDLTRWAKQGVLLINTAHSVIQGKAGSHLKLWELFTLHVMKTLNKKRDLIWMLWGNEARKYGHLIDNKSHALLEYGHPSPLNRSNPFIGCKCFLEVNEELKLRNKSEINW